MDQSNNNLKGFLEIMRDRGELNEPIKSIVEKIMDEGFSSISIKEDEKIESFVETYCKKQMCRICSNRFVKYYTDYIHISEKGMCPECNSKMDMFRFRKG